MTSFDSGGQTSYGVARCYLTSCEPGLDFYICRA